MLYKRVSNLFNLQNRKFSATYFPIKKIQDLGVIVICIFAVYYSLQLEGSFRFDRSFSYDVIPSSSDKESDEAENKMPPPLVTDLNGNGVNEVMVMQ